MKEISFENGIFAAQIWKSNEVILEYMTDIQLCIKSISMKIDKLAKKSIRRVGFIPASIIFATLL